jgi:hypothetical protein
VECILRSVNCCREHDAGKGLWPPIGDAGISDDWYGSTMGVVVRSLGAPGTVAQPM